MRPGDVILAIDDIEVTADTVREILRNMRDRTDLVVVVARSLEADHRVFGDQAQALGITSPKTGGGACCGIFGRGKETRPQKRKSVVGSQAHLESMSPKNFSSLSSLGSAGVRPVDLRKLRKEGAGAMWKQSERNSIE